MKNISLIAILIIAAHGAFSHPGIGIVEDSKGNVYYTDLSRVWKVGPDGKRTIAVDKVHTHELYIDQQDNLFGEHLWYNGEKLNTWGHFVWKLTSAGQYSKVVPDTPGFREDVSFVRDHFGRSYFAERPNGCHTVTRLAGGKKVKLTNTCLEDLRWMTASPKGDVYAVDSEHVKKIDQQGRVIVLAKDVAKKSSVMLTAGPNYLAGISVDNADNVYICDFSGRRVLKINQTGERTVIIETSMPWSPSGFLARSNGDFLVLETSVTNAVRVERISPTGVREVW